MKEITKAWLNASTDDIIAARHLLNVEGLTNMVAFHSQQCLEKAFKAILEETGSPNIKTHDLKRLYKEIRHFLPIPENETLSMLNELYIDSRYPGDLGLLPGGKPSKLEAVDLVNYSASVLDKITKYLEHKH